VSNDTAGTHRDEVMAIASRVIEIVEHEHDRSLFAQAQIDEQIEHFHLVGEVEERRRFVEQHQVRALCQRHRDPHSLTLATRELVDRSRLIEHRLDCTAQRRPADCRDHRADRLHHGSAG